MVAKRNRWATLAAVGLLATGCASQPTQPTVAASPSPSPSPRAEVRRLTIGEGTDYGEFRLTVKEQKVVTDHSANMRAFLVQPCIPAGGQVTQFTAARWELRDRDGWRYQAYSITGSPSSEPSYGAPEGVLTVGPGECVQGWIQFMRTDGVALHYVPHDRAQTIWTFS